MRRKSFLLAVVLLAGVLAVGQTRTAHDDLTDNLREFVEIPAVSGYEQQLASAIAGKLKAYAPVVDNESNVIVTIGKGSPRRLIVAPIDEPGYVVSGMTPDGYLRVQRLPQTGNLPLFNELYAAQPVKIGTRQHAWINGSVAGLSIHLLPQRQHPPSAADLDNMYVDVGATDAAQARAAGVDVLSPLAMQRRLYQMAGGEVTAPAIGDRFGAAALVEVLSHLDTSKISGSVTFAFVAQQWSGARGVQRVIYETHPDEVIYIGRCMRAPAFGPQHEAASFRHHPGDGVLIAGATPQDEGSGIAADFTRLAGGHDIKIGTDYSAPLLPQGGYMLQPELPERTIHLAVATNWPSTPAEVLQAQDVASLASLLGLYLGSTIPSHLQPAPALPEPPVSARLTTSPPVESVLKQLVETYGASEHEQNVRAMLTSLLPAWAKPTTDNGGNLVLHFPSAAAHPAQRIVIVAHMDEIGYEVHSVLPDGELELKNEGGGMPNYFLGHAALVHSSNGMHPGVLELPDGWDKSGFQWPRGRGEAVRMDVGAHNPEQVAQLGIKAGDFVTIPKQYRKLLGTRASGRAMDDRVGDTALVEAVWALTGKSGAAPHIPNSDITFVWSTREELGLFGAAAYAKDAAGEGKIPTFVFAVDTFVSSDSPLESKRFGDALLGRGFVVRAVDNSNIVPPKFVDRVLAIARSNQIPAQYGVTGGGNDGAAFLLYGSTDVALGWPLRYSHSPGEVVDVRDVDGLGKIIAALARTW